MNINSMVRSTDVAEKYLVNKLEGFIHAFKKDRITETQLRGHLQIIVRVDKTIPIDDIIGVAEIELKKIRKSGYIEL